MSKVTWFISHKRKLSKFRTVDDLLEYGVSLDGFYPASLQKMVSIDYLSKIEISCIEFSSKRKEIMDLSKLLVYGILYKKFDYDIFWQFIKSPLIKKWNRINPSRVIDENSNFNELFLQNMMARNAGLISEIFKEILDPITLNIKEDLSLSPDEKYILICLSKRYLESIRSIVWWILSKSRKLGEYSMIIPVIRAKLAEFLDKAKISEYLALMVVELAANAENTRFREVAREVYHRQVDIDRLIANKEIREALCRRMEKRQDQLYMTWKISGRGASIGTENRLKIVLFNRKYDYEKLKEEVEDKKRLDLKDKNLFDFYQEIPEQRRNTELGLFYLSYLNEACEKQNVRFDSNVSQLHQRDLTVITLSLKF
jgi:hypothetical protein